MKINEVILSEIGQSQQDAQKQQRDLHVQRRISGQGVDTRTYGRNIAQADATGVEVGDQDNVARKGTTDSDVAKDTQKTKSDPVKKDRAPSDAELKGKDRRDKTADIFRGRERGVGDGRGKVGSDGRELKHDRFYKDKDVRLSDYDTVLPRLGIKKGVDTAKKYAANFVRNPSDTLADIRYKFKDLLQK